MKNNAVRFASKLSGKVRRTDRLGPGEPPAHAENSLMAASFRT